MIKQLKTPMIFSLLFFNLVINICQYSYTPSMILFKLRCNHNKSINSFISLVGVLEMRLVTQALTHKDSPFSVFSTLFACIFTPFIIINVRYSNASFNSLFVHFSYIFNDFIAELSRLFYFVATDIFHWIFFELKLFKYVNPIYFVFTHNMDFVRNASDTISYILYDFCGILTYFAAFNAFYD